MLNSLNEWQLATATNGSQISVKLIPLRKKQNSNHGLIWVEVGKKVLLISGEEVDFNQDGQSFYISANQLYRLN